VTVTRRTRLEYCDMKETLSAFINLAERGEAVKEKGPVDLFPAEHHNKDVVAGTLYHGRLK